MNTPFYLKSRFLCRSILRRSCLKSGYAVDGNHLFSLADYRRVLAGRFVASVIERPEDHSRRMVRAAELLALTYR